MNIPFDDFFPNDYLPKITPEQYWQVAGFLWKNRSAQAIDFLVRECNLPLLDAINLQKAVDADLGKTFPEPCLSMTGVLNAIDRPDLAAAWLSAYTGQEPAAVDAFIQAVKAQLPGSITPAEMDEIVALIAEREFVPASQKIRGLMNGIDASLAIQSVHDILKYYPPLIAGQLPQKYPYRIVKPGERYSISYRKFELDPPIEQLIVENFRPEDREAVRVLLLMYGSAAWEPEVERVQRVIIKRAEGDPLAVLRLVWYGKIDYRDVLIGE